MRQFSKWAIMQRLQPLQNPYFGSNIKFPKNMSNSILHIIQNCFLQKTARKKTKYSRNETNFEMGHGAKTIAFAKFSLWLKNQNCQKHVKIHSTNRLEWFCKINCSKTRNIPEMRPFSKWAIMQRLQPLQNPYFGLKIKIQKNMSKPILQIIQSCPEQKSARKNTKYSRNDTILKTFLSCNAVSFCI